LLKEFKLVDGSAVAQGQLIAQLEQQELQHDLSLLKADSEQVKLDRDEYSFRTIITSDYLGG